MQIIAICFVCGYRECSKLQFFDKGEKRYVLCNNTICAKCNCEARQKVLLGHRGAFSKAPLNFNLSPL